MASTKEYLDFVLEQLSGLDEIGYRLPAAFKAFFLHVINVATGSAQRGAIQIKEGDSFFDIFIRNITGNVKLFNEALEFSHLWSFLPELMIEIE